jgi:hypothetical protein
MRTLWLLASAAVVGLTMGCGSASAQGIGFGIYVGPSEPADDYYNAPPGYTREYRSGPRVYGYSRRDDDDAGVTVQVERPARRGGCGQYRYWDGDRCVDARNR